MSRTKIEWTNWVCNPFPGCKKVSPGCLNCYAERMARRLKAMGHPAYRDVVDENGWTGKVGWQLEQMKVPGEGKMVFVQSMGDLFYEGIGAGAGFMERDQVFCAILNQPQHIFQVLTKRPDVALEYFSTGLREPPANVWFGVTVENQECADKRIPVLLQIPTAGRFISLEPLLGPITFKRPIGTLEYANGECCTVTTSPLTTFPGINWVVIGCESGPGARPCKIEWVESAAEELRAADIRFWIKQLQIDGKCVRDIERFPKHLQIREYPR